jgi:hypothetical protein
MIFKEMDESKVLEILEGYEDVLTGLVQADQRLYESQSCPQCGSSMVVESDIRRLLSSNRAVPKHLCRCPVCECLIDPFSGLQLEMGNPGNVEPAVPLLHKED